MPRRDTPRDENGHHEDDQPGAPRPEQDKAAQRKHYENEADAVEQTPEDN